jgi:hypothetical protein
MINIITAIVALDSAAQVSVHGDEVIWHDGNPNSITVSQIQTKQAELQTAYDAKAYARTRETAYPSIQDFMEAYTEKEIGSVSTKWDAYVTAYNKVRTDNPK